MSYWFLYNIILYRFQFTDETWSYTNFSSSQASETKFGDSYCLSDGEEVDNKKKEDNCTEFTFAAKHETPKVYQKIIVLTHNLISVCSGIILEKVEKDGSLDPIHSDLQEEEISLGATCRPLRELSQRD